MVAALLLLVAVPAACFAASLPVVDLGYELHRASSFNITQGLYNFSNIRYAAAPVGDLRFRAPVWPEENRARIQDGSVGRVCPQASPIWETEIEQPFLASLLTGSKFNQSTNISSYPYVSAKRDPRTTEDCLFLDVVVPKKIFDRGQNRPSKNLAPVLVWIYGGGYTGGEKSSNDPSGLIKRSEVVGEGIVYVTLNYRLGAFGWLGGDSILANGTANVGLHDQRFALDWVYKNIHLFGGDSKRVTVMGESAGAGSIMHQITAYSGRKGPSPFHQAILQSPGWVPVVSEDQQEETLQQFLGILNVSTIEEARKLPSEKLIAGNAYQVATRSSYGSFVYGPVVDGTFVPELPGQLLRKGGFDHNLKIMVGHNADEGLEFTSPENQNSSAIVTLLKTVFPNMKQNLTEYITKTLYPATYDGKYGYKNPVERAALLVSDSIFVCNTDYINRAFANKTYAYEFSVPPAIHGQDVQYTFANTNRESSSGSLGGLAVANATTAKVMQDYFTSFTQRGVPKSPLGPIFKQHGQGRLINIGNNSIQAGPDSSSNSRCRFWQTVSYT